jgi:hypothetical protein
MHAHRGALVERRDAVHEGLQLIGLGARHLSRILESAKYNSAGGDRAQSHPVVADWLKRLMGVAGAVVRGAVAPAGQRSGAIGGLVLDLTRSRKELLAENAFLRTSFSLLFAR